LQVLFTNIALGFALTAATASAKHSGVKVMKLHPKVKKTNVHSTKLIKCTGVANTVVQQCD